MPNNSILVDESMIAYADIEDGQLFLIHSVLVKETDSELESVWATVGDRPPTVDRIEDNPLYLHGKARIRRWEL